MKPALCVAIFSMVFGVQLVHAACPNDAVFLSLNNQIRGYSLRANGAAEPCQLIQGPLTTLTTGEAIALDKHSNFHVAQFLSNATVDIFARNARGNQAPYRSFTFQTNDLSGIGVDSRLNDFVLNFRPSTAGVLVVVANTTGVVTHPIVITDSNISEYQGIAVDSDDNLLIAGYDTRGAAVIDVFDTSKSLTSPPLLRSITGTNTGLFPSSGGLPRHNISLAIDPVTEELYAYNVSTDLTQFQVSVFAHKANGNVAPVRTISGPATGITGPSIDAGANKIAISSDGRLLVAEPNLRILAFAPGARGNVAPSQVIEDSTPGPTTQGGIAARARGGGRQNENDDAQ